MTRRCMQLPIALAMVVSMGLQASATLTLSTGLVGGSGDVENVLMSPLNQTGMTITGELNQSGLLVNFTSDELLTNPAGGQARIEAVDGAFSLVSITMADADLGFEKIQFNIDAADDGFADITLIDQFGSVFLFEDQALDGNGQNFFTGGSLDGQIIVEAIIDTSIAMTAISDLQQVRLGAVDVPPTNPVPEPTSFLVWATLLIGGVWRLRNERR